jgi:hypothetical protein
MNILRNLKDDQKVNTNHFIDRGGVFFKRSKPANVVKLRKLHVNQIVGLQSHGD